MNILIVYVLSFILISAVDAFWHLVLFGKQYSQWFAPVARMTDGKIALNGLPGILSQLLVVASMLFLILYKTNGQPKYVEGMLVGAAAGILGISVYGLVNYALINHWEIEITILEVLWGPMIGAIAGAIIVFLTKRFM